MKVCFNGKTMTIDPTVLLTAAGAAALARVAELAGGRGELAVAAALRREFPADLAAAATAQAGLREKAAAKFSRAGEMLFTRAGYEQSSGEVIARHRAARYGAMNRVADLCCGIGGDLLALAGERRSVREIMAVDLDSVHARLARHNAEVYGGAVRPVVADVRDVPLGSFDGVFIDPARRSGDRRFRAGVCEPPLDWCFDLVKEVAAVGVKAAPGLPAELIPAGWEAEFIADGRDLKEAVLWSPALASGERRATVLPGGEALTAVPGDPVAVGEPGEYLLDPSPAVTRAGLVEDLARTLGGWKIDDRIGFIALGAPAETPFGRTLRVLHSAPWNEKRFAARLRELGVGAADLRRRGLAGDVDVIRRRLRLSGPNRATVVLTRVSDRPWGLICELLRAFQDSPDERGLAGVLSGVVDDADQAHAEGHRRVPVRVDHAGQVGVLDPRHVLDGERVDGLVVAGEQVRLGRDLLRHRGDLRGRVAETDLGGVRGQAEPGRPASVGPHLRHAERARDVIVGHPAQVPDQPGDGVGVRIEAPRELLLCESGHNREDRFPDAAEGVGQQFGTRHSVLPRERLRNRRYSRLAER